MNHIPCFAFSNCLCFSISQGSLCTWRPWGDNLHSWWWYEASSEQFASHIQWVSLCQSRKRLQGSLTSLIWSQIIHLSTYFLLLLFFYVQVCDQPHPLHVKNMVRNVLESKFDDACHGMKQLYDLGYSPTDIITTLFRIIKNYDMAEYLKLEFMKVCIHLISSSHFKTSSYSSNTNYMFFRKLVLRIWESVMELDHTSSYVVFLLS